MSNYDQLKQIAKDSGCRVKDLIALSPNNDPFYCGTDGDRAMGEWFASLWSRFGYGGGVHVRRVHYQLISTPEIKLPNGEDYENTERCWGILTMASKAARYLELVDPADFVDRRNPEAVSYIYDPYGEPEISVSNDLWYDAPKLPDFPSLPDYAIENYESGQRYHIEVWAEKSTMNDVLLPVCEAFGAVLQTGLGELSITATLQAVERINERNKPARIFYVSDFDPAGQSMPVAVARKIEYFINRNASHLDVRLQPIILTEEQVREYRLPRTPIKDTEKRAGAFESRFGTGAVELDALEAIHPGELRRVLSDAMREFFDRTLDRRVRAERQRLETDLSLAREEVLQPYLDRINELRSTYSTIQQEFNTRIEEMNAEMLEMWESIEDELKDQMVDLDDYPLPEPDEVYEGDDVLFDSTRSYMDQLSNYKEFQGKL